MDDFEVVGKPSEGLTRIAKLEHIYHDTYEYMHGYIDGDNNVVIECKHYKAGDFHEGLAYATPRGVLFGIKFGFINTTGKMVIKAQFDEAGNFYKGLAPVILDGKHGVIDHTGNFTNKFDLYKNLKGMQSLETRKRELALELQNVTDSLKNVGVEYNRAIVNFELS